MGTIPSIDHWQRRYGTEENCARELYQLRWPNGYCCPICRRREATVIRTRRLPLFECKHCRYQNSLTTGTVMEKSKTPLRKWFLAMFLLARGATARQLSDALQVTYKTAWLIGHKIRHAILLVESEMRLAGAVRVQEGRFGAASFASLFNREAKREPLIVAGSVSADGGLDRVKLHQVPPIHRSGGRISKEGFRHFENEHISPQANVVTAAGLYNAASHPLSRFCRTAVRRMNTTYCGLRPKHLQSYLDEYTYRHQLTSAHDLSIRDLLQRCATRPVITYPQLIRKAI